MRLWGFLLGLPGRKFSQPILAFVGAHGRIASEIGTYWTR